MSLGAAAIHWLSNTSIHGVAVNIWRISTLVCALVLSFASSAQQPPVSDSANKQLTIEAIFSEGGVTGQAPEGMQWSPDGTKLSYVQRDDSGEHGALYYIDLATGKSAVLVSSEKLAMLAPSANSTKDERQKEAMQRYAVAAYHWSPDSKHLLFDSLGQLWLYSLETGTAVQLTTSADAASDPKFSPAGERVAYIRKHDLFVRAIKSGQEDALTRTGNDNLLNGEVDWVYREELYT